jgi:hypothetical protein
VVAVEVARNPSKRSRNDSKSSKRGKRRFFASTAVYKAILRGCMGIPGNPTIPIFGCEFKLMFRLSKPRFQRLMEGIMAEDLSSTKKEKSSSVTTIRLEAKLWLPLKFYGVPSHTFIVSFQMSQSHARDCCFEFDKATKHIYAKSTCDGEQMLIQSQFYSYTSQSMSWRQCLDLSWK